MRRKVNCKAATGSICPKEATARKLFTGVFCRWIIGHIHDIQSYLMGEDKYINPGKP